MGKYCCLLCPKEFSSESGVKYHILKAHAEVRQGRAWCESPAGPAAGCAGPTEGAGEGRGVRVTALHLSEWATLRSLLVSLQSSLRLP